MWRYHEAPARIIMVAGGFLGRRHVASEDRPGFGRAVRASSFREGRRHEPDGELQVPRDGYGAFDGAPPRCRSRGDPHGRKRGRRGGRLRSPGRHRVRCVHSCGCPGDLRVRVPRHGREGDARRRDTSRVWSGGARAWLAERGGFDLSTFREPYRAEGKKTMAFELFEQMDGVLPDAIVYPTGGGTGLVAMWKAFDEMQQIGWIGSARPRLISVQADGCAPLVKAFEEGREEAEVWENPTTQIPGLRAPKVLADFLWPAGDPRKRRAGNRGVGRRDLRGPRRGFCTRRDLDVPGRSSLFRRAREAVGQRRAARTRPGGVVQYRIRAEIRSATAHWPSGPGPPRLSLTARARPSATAPHRAPAAWGVGAPSSGAATREES